MHWTDLANERIDRASLDALSSKERKRYEALWELFHAEVTYITDHLLVLKEVICRLFLLPVINIPFIKLYVMLPNAFFLTK